MANRVLVVMSEATQSTDELISEYTSARHIYALADGANGDIDTRLDAHDKATSIESVLESRGIPTDALRDFWSHYAESHGLDH